MKRRTGGEDVKNEHHFLNKYSKTFEIIKTR